MPPKDKPPRLPPMPVGRDFRMEDDPEDVTIEARLRINSVQRGLEKLLGDGHVWRVLSAQGMTQVGESGNQVMVLLLVPDPIVDRFVDDELCAISCLLTVRRMEDFLLGIAG